MLLYPDTMGFITRHQKFPRALTFKKGTDVFNIQLGVHGQCVFQFEYAGGAGCGEGAAFRFCDAEENPVLSVEFKEGAVTVVNAMDSQPLTDPNNTKGLVSIPGASYWFSLDAHSLLLQAGIGEARKETAVYRYQFPAGSETIRWLERITNIDLGSCSRRDIAPLRLLRDPITRSVPLAVLGTDALTMDHIAASTYMPASNLATMGQKLYSCISGKSFVLDTADFPDFSKAIEYSIATPTCWCHETLKTKSQEFGPVANDKETYLRITLNENNGESPGIPYVMEIWPGGHFSPIHNHGGANAVIRVLHGRIHVSLFSFLGGDSFGSADFGKDDVTWISPALNQVHQLKNVDDMVTCVTIQCYMYDGEDAAHYDYFDYLDNDGKVQQFEPNSDMDFVAFKELMRKEWASRPTVGKLGFLQRIKRFFSKRTAGV
jgi:hypothetical protein